MEYVPESLEEGVLYVSIPFATVLHLCCCGCGNEVVTPLDPTDWQLTFDGRSVSLSPSIGNWSFDCQSHYWINRNHVRWARQLSEKEIRRVRVAGLIESARRYGFGWRGFLSLMRAWVYQITGR